MIRIKNLYKIYKNGKIALTDINLEIHKGEFTAILGPNGAGKTTLINILGGNVKKTEGSVTIDRWNIDTDELNTKKIIGIVPQEISTEPFFTVYEVLALQSGYFGIRNNSTYINELLQALGLEEKRDSNCRALSGGMKRRLLIAKALVHRPKICILDEPTAGVDVELRQSLYLYLRKLHKIGITIVLTTHYLEEAELLCKRIVILNKGQIIADNTARNLIKSLGGTIKLILYLPRSVGNEKLMLFKNFHPIEEDKILELTVKKIDLCEIFSLLKKHDINFQDFTIKEPKLEDVFLKLIH